MEMKHGASSDRLRTAAVRGLRVLVAAGGMMSLLVTLGCWGEKLPDSSGGGGGGSTISGKVIQGPVAGATVFADRIVANGLGDMTMDSTEAATQTTTDANGNYTLPVTPSYSYVVVSKGGVDSLSKEPAGMMLAPAGAQNVSSLTTMVALDTTGTVKAKIESLGGTYDSNYAASATPALIFFAKSIETAVKALETVLNPDGATLSAAQVQDVQLKTMTAMVVELAKPATTTATLDTPAALQTLVTTAVTSSATTLDATYTNIAISNPATVATNVANTVTAVAVAVSGSATASLSTDPLTATSEAAALPPSDLNTISTAVDTSVATNATVVSTQPPAATADTTPPTVLSTSPATGASGISANSKVTAEFSEALDLSTVTAANFTVAGTPGTVSWNNTTNVVTFTPSVNFPVSTALAVTISGMKDLAGNTMAPRAWSFTTAAALDTTPPTVTATTPANGATGVNASTVTVVFSEAMDSATVSNGSFKVSSGGLNLPGTVSYDPTTRTATFTPASKLLIATSYTVSVSGAKDMAGNTMAPVTSGFTTTNTGSGGGTVTF